MGDLDKLIVAKGFKKLPKVQYIAQSGHTVFNVLTLCVRNDDDTSCIEATSRMHRRCRLPEWEVSEDKKPFCSIFNFDTSRNDFDFHLDFARRRRRRQT